MRVTRQEQKDSEPSTPESRALASEKAIAALNAVIARCDENTRAIEALKKTDAQAPSPSPAPRVDAAIIKLPAEMIARAARCDVKDIQCLQAGMAVDPAVTKRIQDAAIACVPSYIDVYCRAMRDAGANALKVEAERRKLQAQFFGS